MKQSKYAVGGDWWPEWDLAGWPGSPDPRMGLVAGVGFGGLTGSNPHMGGFTCGWLPCSAKQSCYVKNKADFHVLKASPTVWHISSASLFFRKIWKSDLQYFLIFLPHFFFANSQSIVESTQIYARPGSWWRWGSVRAPVCVCVPPNMVG